MQSLEDDANKIEDHHRNEDDRDERRSEDDEDADSIDGSRSEKADDGVEKENESGGVGGGDSVGGGDAGRAGGRPGNATRRQGDTGEGKGLNPRDPLPPLQKPPWKLAYKNQ